MTEDSANLKVLNPDDQRSIASYRSLAAAFERAQSFLSPRVDIQQFRIGATMGLGRRLVEMVSRDRGYREA